MKAPIVIMRLTLRQLLAGKRVILIGLLAGVPLLLPALVASASSNIDPAIFTRDLIRGLVLPLLLPVLALLLSTNAIGAELRDGTVTNLVLKPVTRGAIIAAKYLACVVATLLVLWPPQIAAHLIVAGGLGSTTLLTGALVATALAVAAYCALGVLMSLFIPRALLVGLIYALLWEGAVVSVAPSASSLSIRGYTEGVFAAILEHDRLTFATRLGPVSATVLALTVTVGALALSVRRLRRMDFR